MKKIYKAAIIGCGAIAGGYDEKSRFRHIFTHAGAYKKHPRFKLEAIAEVNKKRLSEFKEIWHIQRGYTNYKDLLKKEDIDLVSVCVPDYLHTSVINDILEYGRAKCILGEKPIASTFKEAVEIIKRCKKKNISLYINYNRLWEPAHRITRRLVAEGFLGDIQGGICYYVRGIKHNGSTMINTLRFLLGTDIAYVQGLRIMDSAIPNDFSMDGLLALNNGVKIFLVAADKRGYGHSIFEIDLMGNKGRIRLIDNGHKVKVYKTTEYRRYPGVRELDLVSNKKHKLFPENKMNRTLLLTLDEIAFSLDRGILSLNYAKEAMRDLRIIETLIASANKKGIQLKVGKP